MGLTGVLTCCTISGDQEGKFFFLPCSVCQLWPRQWESCSLCCFIVYNMVSCLGAPEVPSSKFFVLLWGKGIGNAKDCFFFFLCQIAVVSLALLLQVSSMLQGLASSLWLF